MRLRSAALLCCRTLAASFILLAFLDPAQLAAQTADQIATPQSPRIASAADLRPATRLSGHLPAWAQPANDLGPIDPSTPIHLQLLISRAPQLQAAFDQRLADQQNPASPLFHHWLTPAQIGQLYGPLSGDLAAVTGWLTAQGLQVDSIAPSGIFIQASAPAATVAAAFQAPLHAYRLVTGSSAHSWRAPTQEPAIPTAFAAIITGIQGLTEVPVEPQSASEPQPAFTTSAGTHLITPGDFAIIYDLNPVYSAGINGAGYHVAIIGLSRVAASDIAAYQTIFALPANTLNIIIPPLGADPGQTNNSDQSEATLDVERVLGTAPGAQPDLIVSSPASGGLITAISHNVQTLLDPVMTISFGSCEANAGRFETTFYANLFAQGAAEGISTFVSAGDSGAAGCDTHGSAPPATQQLSINAYCASGFVTCVGGTELNDTASPSTYWSSSNTLPGRTSALSYIPEGVWNDPVTSTGAFTVLAGGGGASLYFSKPAFQTGPGVPADGVRDTPDISFSASLHDGYSFCYINSGSGPCVLNTSNNTVTSSSSNGGTSASAPSMAGIAALLDQKLGGPQGSLNPLIYRLANRVYSTVFHDATIASSGVTNCTLSTPSLCNNSTASGTSATLTTGQTGYLLTTGYDLATGWGSLDVANFLAAAATAGAASKATLTGPAGTLTVGQTLTFNITVAPAAASSTIPTGTAQLYINGAPAGAAPTSLDATGNASIAVASSTLTPGPLQVTAAYSGDATYEGATTNPLALSLSAAGVAPATVTLAASANPVDPTQSVTLTATFASVSNIAPTGLLAIYAVDGGSLYRVTSVIPTSGRLTYTTSGLVAGTHTYVATYLGDANYAASSSATLALVSNPIPTTTILTGSTFAVPAAASAYTVTVTGLYSNISLQGLAAIQIFDGATQIAALKPTPATSSTATTTGTAIFNLTLAAGSHSLTAVYPGDFYSSASTSSAIVILSANPGITLTPASATLTTSAGGSPTDALTITSVGGYTGAAGLTCAVSYGGTLTVNAPPTCTVAPASVTVAAAGTAAATLTITTTAPHTAVQRTTLRTQSQPSRSPAPLLAGLLACLPLFALRRRSNLRLLSLLFVSAAGLLLLAATGCGGGASSSTQVPGTTAATYTVTISGGPGTTSAILGTVSVTVQ